MKALHPELWKNCPNFMGHRTIMTLPELFQKIDIKVYTGEQTIGTYVLTWPGAYHFGGNLGLNYAEATAWASSDWINYFVNTQHCNCTTPQDTFHDDDEIIPILKNTLNPNQFKQWNNSRTYKSTNRHIRTIQRCINYPGAKEIKKYKCLGEKHFKQNIAHQMASYILKEHIDKMN